MTMKVVRNEKAEVILDFKDGKITRLHGFEADRNKSDEEILLEAKEYYNLLLKKIDIFI